MEAIKISEIVSAVKGIFINPSKNIDEHQIKIDSLSTDSRVISAGDLFIPLTGDKFDGHDFIPAAFEKGALLSLSQRRDIKIPEGKGLILVEDTKQALMDLATYYRSLFSIPVIAVTGSVGKTSTKDMIASVLGQSFKVLKTQGNFNNEIGVPLTIFNLSREDEIAVIEMGMNHFGEIHNLSKIARPDMAVITNIGTSHIENLGSREGILKAKSEIFDYMKKKGKAFLNGDDDLLVSLRDQLTVPVCFFGLSHSNDIYANKIEEKGLEGTYASIVWDSNEMQIEIPVPGRHMVYNALVAVAIGLELGMTKEKIKEGIKNYQASKMRMNISRNKKGIYIINDAYNASPQSMKAALDVLSQLKEGKRKIVVLGDMLELGTYSEQAHKEVGEYVAKKALDYLFTFGREAENIALAAMNAGMDKNKVFIFLDQEELFNQLQMLVDSNDMILFKASRGMHLEKTVEKLEEVE